MRAAVELNRPFEPATARDGFVVGVSDYAEFVLAPPLVARLRERAPGVSAVFRHADREVALALLDQDRAHLAVGIFPEPPARMTRIVLLRDDFVVLLRGVATRRPAASTSTAISPGRICWSRRWPAARGRSTGPWPRSAAAASWPQSSRTIWWWRRSCRAARCSAPWRGGSRTPLAAAFGLALLPLPAGLVLAPQPTSLVFHNRYAQRPAHRWLRALVAETARRLGLAIIAYVHVRFLISR